jgi:hypothetical protein
MREQFQKALSELTASPELVKRVRKNPNILREQYDLTGLEWHRLNAMAKQSGMECNCVLYRANRLAPIVINLPEFCKAVERDLRSIMSEYWGKYPQIGANFWIEANDFCEFIKEKAANGEVSETVLPILEREQSAVVAQLAQIYPEKYGSHPIRS